MAISKLVVTLFFSLSLSACSSPLRFQPRMQRPWPSSIYCYEIDYAVKVTRADVTPWPVKRGVNATFNFTAATGDGVGYLLYRKYMIEGEFSIQIMLIDNEKDEDRVDMCHLRLYSNFEDNLGLIAN
ncbi:PREDICTED: uncharacterized protein LOC109182030 isoform X1 [Ipomoea nil]|uniref:uncharacterized protein LOC109182030 isoform X1 n=1 Tax=Ipomoea nil TaxID=35883 RepID=UPI000901094B|nr:PREDICTED: uncharacterized protein LOC109182030 isoform X1 [Ipomoea nil]